LPTPWEWLVTLHMLEYGRILKLIRELDGKRFVYHIDLTASWMSNPDYQIRQNDIIIVTPNKLKVNSAGLIKDLYRPYCSLITLYFLLTKIKHGF
jgi:polysaccharide export outer membrane protein